MPNLQQPNTIESMFKHQLLAVVLLFFAYLAPAQVIINEISAANLNGISDGAGDYEDWVELYNPGATPVNISGWFLSDNPAKPQKWKIPAGQTINANGYKLIFCSGKDKVEGVNLHSNFKITQTAGESVLLTKSNNTLADSYTFTIPNQLNHSYGRSPNGGATWKIYNLPTPTTANGAISFQQYAPAVTATPDAGGFPGTTPVSLSTDPGFSIRYTIDGTEPTSSSSLYNTPINITTTTVLKARAFSSNAQILPGFVTANTYFINVSHTIPIVSISGDNVNNLLNGGNGIPTVGCFEYFENMTVEAEGYGQFNKHGNDSWAYPQRGVDWITRDQMGYTDALKEKFFPERTRKKFQRLILKAAANDNYPYSAGGAHLRDAYVQTLAIHGGFDLDARTCLFCVLYVNGKYWGVYDLREKVDDADFTSFYYDQDENNVDFIKTWGNTWYEYGDGTAWYNLKAFILGNDMSIPANYNTVKSQFDLQSLVDYIILNQHVVCKDWLNWNTAWWRGRNPSGGAQKWRYALWDEDATLGHYVNYTGIPDPTAFADPCDVEQIQDWGDPQNHIDILMALFNNPDFKSLYINRYAELLNTSLSCQYMNALLDSMAKTIEPEMPGQCQRWGGTIAEWKQNVQQIHDFINTRCVVLDQSIVNCYDVTGPFQLNVKISPAASPNHVTVNTYTPGTYPYTGDFFGDVSIPLTAVPAQGWQFDHWEVNGNTFTPNQFSDAVTLAFQQSGMVTAFFVSTSPCGSPTDLMVQSNNPDTTTVEWSNVLLAGSYNIRYRKVGDPTWTEINSTQSQWLADQLPGCTDFEMEVQSVCPVSTSLYSSINFTTPDHLTGFDIPDQQFCNQDTALLDATVAGANYLWENGSSSATRAITNPGTYWVKVDQGACSKTDTIEVKQFNTVGNLQSAICPGGSLVIGGSTFDVQHPSGQVILPGAAISGCDSIVNVSLKINAISQTTLLATSCDPAAVGQDTLHLQTVAGCDSLLITITSFAPVSQTTLSASSCDPAMAGVDTLVLSSVHGCDSLVITTTTLIPITPSFLSASSCDPSQIGADTLILSSVHGCDSLVITNTSFLPLNPTHLTASTCNPAQVGTDTLLLSNAHGCDSLVITQTSFDPSGISITLLSVKSCDTLAVGLDTLVLHNITGCDSIVITTTSLAFPSYSFLTKSSCDPALAGMDTLKLSNFYGCDSLVITTTNFIPITPTHLTASSCNPAAVGLDTLVLSNVYGCDSLLITNTLFDPSGISFTQLTAKSCDPAAVGKDTLVLHNITGCDSLVITTTSLLPVSKTFLSRSSCKPDQAGTDTLTLSNIYGCDSLVITNTVFDPNAISITKLNLKTCDITTAGKDTLYLQNLAGCDSLVVTTRTYSGLSLAKTSFEDFVCFGQQTGSIRVDTVLTPAALPLEIELENVSSKIYSGSPISWDKLPAGVYTLSATNAEGCSDTQSLEIKEGQPLHLDFPESSVTLHVGDSILLSPTLDFPGDLAAWTPSLGLSCPHCLSTYLKTDVPGIYQLKVYDPNGCEVSAAIQVLVEKGIRLYVPNAISPESGGENAVLPISAGPEVIRIRSFQIFDRWGDQIYAKYDFPPNSDNTWDGTWRGKQVPPGVVVWYCELDTYDGQTLKFHGDITVLR